MMSNVGILHILYDYDDHVRTWLADLRVFCWVSPGGPGWIFAGALEHWLATQPMTELAFLHLSHLSPVPKSSGGFPLSASSSIFPNFASGLEGFGRWRSFKAGRVAMLRNLQMGHARSDWEDLAPVWHVSETGPGR